MTAETLVEETLQLDSAIAPNIFQPGEYLTLRVEMIAADEIAIKNLLFANPHVKVSLEDSQRITQQQMIVGWNLTIPDPANDGQGISLPYSPKNVSKLPAPIRAYVQAKINEYNPDLDEEGGVK